MAVNLKSVRPYQWAALAIVFIAFAVAIWAYPRLPEQVASHWNAAGEVDDYISRFWGAFLMPIIAAVMWPMVVVLPAIDPRSANIKRFSREFDQLIFGLFLFLLYVYGLTLFWNFGHRFHLGQLMVPALGLLFIQVGRMTGKAHPNFTAGIRTPWTLSSERVWRETHDLGGRLFIGAGLVSFFGLLLPDQAIYLVLVPVVGAALVTIVYSYFAYQREQKEIQDSGQGQGDTASGQDQEDTASGQTAEADRSGEKPDKPAL